MADCANAPLSGCAAALDRLRRKTAHEKRQMRLETSERRRVQPNQRKLRARHLIQLGALVEKIGLAGTLELEGDFQNEPESEESMAVLLGALDYVKWLLEQEGKAADNRKIFEERGRKLLAKDQERGGVV